VLRCLNHLNNDGTPLNVPRLAHFVTADVLLRLHNFVQEARRQGDRCGGWPKQATLAVVVGSFTGVALRRADAEFIGNAQDSFLNLYTKELKKARDADNKQLARARKAGVAVQPTRVASTKERIYTCKYGGVPRTTVAGEANESLPLHNQPVPFRRVHHAAEISLQLQQEIRELKAERQSERETWQPFERCTIQILLSETS